MMWSMIELMLKRMVEGLGRFQPYLARLLVDRLNADAMIQTCESLVVGLASKEDREMIREWLKSVRKAKDARNALVHSSWISLFVGDENAWVPGTLQTRLDKKNGEARDVFTRVDMTKLEGLKQQLHELTFRELPAGAIALIIRNDTGPWTLISPATPAAAAAATS